MVRRFLTAAFALALAASAQAQVQPNPAGGGSAALANPTGTIGGAAVNGTATTAMRSDAAPALGIIGLANGGTNATTAAGALTSLGAESAWFPGYITGQSVWYIPPFQTIGNSSSPLTNRQHCSPFVTLNSVTINQLGLFVTTAGTTNLQLAIYANAVFTSKNRPSGTPIAYTGNVPDTTANTAVSGAITPTTATIPAGMYWACMMAGDTTMAFVTTSLNNGMAGSLIGSTTQVNVINAYNDASLDIYYGGGSYGTWPNFTSATTWTENNTGAPRAPLIMFRVN